MIRAHRLVDTLRPIDESVTHLQGDARCEWVRSTFGIVGKVAVPSVTGTNSLNDLISREVDHALALIDQIPDKQLDEQELWNLVLFISVPWTRLEAQTRSEIARVLAQWARNTVGCRKVILWSDVDIQNHLGPLGLGGEGWVPPLGDPLRDTISSSSLDEEERLALDVLFKRRIEASDIEQVIRTLGRGRI
jgi:hypothetical protein